jgi:glycosyltransferase involved in cell wall biosynthesis
VLGRPLSVAMFSDSALPVLNGVSISIDALVQGLRNAGHSVQMFTTRHAGHRDSDANTHRFMAVETPWTRDYPLALPPFYFKLPRFRRSRFDVVHTHTPFTLGFVGLRWAESAGLPVVSTYHTLYDKYAHYVPFFPKGYVRYKIAKHTNYYYNCVDEVIVPSAQAARWLRRHSVKTPMSVIPTGIPKPNPRERREAREALGIGPGRKVALYVGRIAREKNMGTLLQGIALARQRDPRLMLMLVGDGPFRRQCVERSWELGIGDHVRFVGFVPRSQVDQYYTAADLFTFCSITETQGLVVGEAMSYGLPAVVVQGGGAGALIEDGVNGLLVKNDAFELAEAVLSVLRNPDLAASLSASAKSTIQSYGTEEMVRQIVGVYRRAIGEELMDEERAIVLR